MRIHPSRGLAVFVRVALFCSAVCASALVAGCSAKGTVALTAAASDPSLTVTTKLLGTALDGGFTLDLNWGSAAGGDTKVSFDSAGLRDVNGVILDTLALTSTTEFPVDLAPGSGVGARMTFDPSKLEDGSVHDQLCGANQLRFFGTVTDSATGDVTPFSSSPFEPTCP